MDNFTIIYKILKALEAAMDFEAFDVSKISHERLGISYERWEKILIMLKSPDTSRAFFMISVLQITVQKLNSPYSRSSR